MASPALVATLRARSPLKSARRPAPASAMRRAVHERSTTAVSMNSYGRPSNSLAAIARASSPPTASSSTGTDAAGSPSNHGTISTSTSTPGNGSDVHAICAVFTASLIRLLSLERLEQRARLLLVPTPSHTIDFSHEELSPRRCRHREADARCAAAARHGSAESRPYSRSSGRTERLRGVLLPYR